MPQEIPKEPEHKSLKDLIKDDSNIISLAFEDDTPNRDNWSEFFETLGSFLKAWNVRLVGLDKKVYAKMVAERIERLRASAQIKQQEEKPQIITGQEKPNATPQIIVAKS